MTIHTVKSWVHLFQAMKSGIKTHDLRNMTDRDYKVGDILVLQEYDMTTGEYTGDELVMEITYITSNQTPCAISSMALHRDVAVLSLRKGVIYQ